MCSADTCREKGIICPLSWQPEDFSSENFHHFTLCVVQNCSPCRLGHEIMTAVSHWHQTLESQEAPRHVECATRLHPYVTAAIFHIKGHDLTLIVREVGGVLMHSRTNVHVFADASLWDPTQLRLCAWSSPRPPPTPSCVREGARCNLPRMLKWSK